MYTLTNKPGTAQVGAISKAHTEILKMHQPWRSFWQALRARSIATPVATTAPLTAFAPGTINQS